MSLQDDIFDIDSMLDPDDREAFYRIINKLNEFAADNDKLQDEIDRLENALKLFTD